MLETVIKYKRKICALQHLLPYSLTEEDWKSLQIMNSVLKHSYETTVKLQSAKITLSEISLFFY